MNIGDLLFRLVADGSNLERDVQKEAQKAGDAGGKTLGQKLSGGLSSAFDSAKGKVTGFGGAFKSMASGALLGVGLGAFNAVTSAVGGLSDAIIGGASDQAESLNKLRVVFGDAAAGVEAFAKNSARDFGLSKAAAYGALGTLGNLFTAMKIAPQRAADMSQGIVKLSADLASFNNASPEETLQAIQSGLTGETEPLRRFGVNLNAARIEAKAMELGLAGTNGELDAAAKAQATYALILEDTTSAQGDFARTSGGLANQQRIAGAVMADAFAKIGEKIIPLVEKIMPAVVTAFELFANVAGPAIDVLGVAVSAVADVVMPVFKGIGDGVRQLAEFFLTAAGTIVGVAASIPGPWQDGAKQLQASLDGMKDDVKNWGKDSATDAADGAAKVPGAIRDEFDAGRQPVTDGAKQMVGGVVGAVDQMRYDAAESAKKLPGDVAKGILEEQAKVGDAMSALEQQIKNERTPAQQAAQDIGNTVGATLAHALTDTRPGVRDAANAVRDTAEEELAKFIVSGGTIGKKAMAQLVAAEHSKDPAVRAQAHRTRKIIETGIVPTSNAAVTAAYNLGTRAVRALKKGWGTPNLRANIILSNSGYLGGARAKGGPVQAGVPYLVGERGPEIVVPRLSGVVLPSADTAARAGIPSGDNITINVPVTGMPLYRESPRDIALEMRRLGDLGVIPPRRRRGSWE